MAEFVHHDRQQVESLGGESLLPRLVLVEMRVSGQRPGIRRGKERMCENASGPVEREIVSVCSRTESNFYVGFLIGLSEHQRNHRCPAIPGRCY